MCIFWEFDKIVFSIFLFIKCMKVLGKIYFINNIIWIRKYKYGIYVIYEGNNINFSISLTNNIKRDKFFLILLISEFFFFKLIYFIFMFFVFLYGFFFIERVLGS